MIKPSVALLLDIALKRAGVDFDPDSVQIGRRDNKSTWLVTTATTADKDLADSIIAGFNFRDELVLYREAQADDELDNDDLVKAIVLVFAPLVGRTELQLFTALKDKLRRRRRQAV